MATQTLAYTPSIVEESFMSLNLELQALQRQCIARSDISQIVVEVSAPNDLPKNLRLIRITKGNLTLKADPEFEGFVGITVYYPTWCSFTLTSPPITIQGPMNRTHLGNLSQSG